MDMSAEQRRRDFGVWMRTGRWPLPGDHRGHEVKFNPWHDPKDGRFTFSGTGRHYGPGGTGRTSTPSQKAPKIEYFEDSRLPPISTREEVEAWKVEELAKHGHKPGYRRAIEEQYRRYLHELVKAPSDSAKAADGPNRPAPSHSTRNVDLGTGVGFSGGGGDFAGGGASGSWKEAPAPRPAQRQNGLRSNSGGFSGRGGSGGGGGATGSWGSGGFRGGGGGSFGGGGASSSEKWPAAQVDRAPAKPAGAQSSPPTDRWRQVTRNGYVFEIDEQNRTRRVSGEITFKLDQRRSRTAQRAAGGDDRRASDHGGHYIARRFNGPTEAFNHFAQDSNFNRGDYFRLEEEWARAKRAGKSVRVKIVPAYEGGSQRPSALNMWFWINGERKSARFSNEPKGGKRGG